MSEEQTLMLVKPDGVQRGLVGEIIRRTEATGLRIAGIKMIHMDRDLASRHYAEHVGKPFYQDLVSFITSAPIVAVVMAGPNAIALVRKLVGATSPSDAAPGTIRGALAVDIGRNLVHGSATLEDADRERSLFFSSEELCDYRRNNEDWIFEP